MGDQNTWFLAQNFLKTVFVTLNKSFYSLGLCSLKFKVRW